MQLFLDLDGVFADFNRGVYELTGKMPEEQSMSNMWKACARHENFFGSLELMPDALELWNEVKHLNPTFLTGIPFGGWAPRQKRGWVGLKFGYEYNVITCFSKEKHLHCNEGDILVDDRIKTKPRWESAGGIFVHHTSSKESIKELKKLGVI